MSWAISYYRTADDRVPGEDYLDGCPAKVEANLLAVIEAVREAPPPAFSGGGKWEAMHGTMHGYYEARATGPGRMQYRLFCVLENADKSELARRGFKEPQIVVINGMTKPVAELFSDREYRKNVRDLGAEHRANFPRRIAEP